MTTPLQKLLIERVQPLPTVRRATSVSRITVWRWQTGSSFPCRLEAKQLIALYGTDEKGVAKLDYNGCYTAVDPNN